MNGIVAIVGRPNVGKSTLFNRLIEQRQAIVDDQPGITRDRNTGVCEWGGHSFVVMDTGGYVADSPDVFDAAVREQVEIALQEADVILFLVDVKDGLLPQDQEIAQVIRRYHKKNVLLVVNKVDNYERELHTGEFHALGLPNLHSLSAVSGTGTGELLEEVTKMLPSDTEAPKNTDIPKIAIIGRPNVGKSSLINALLGRNQHIVTPVAGTTRDSIYTRYQAFGFDFFLVDTAGLRKRAKVKDNVEFYSAIRTVRAIQECDVALVLIDAQTGMEAQDLHIIGLVERHKKPLLILANKWDLVKQDNMAERKLTEQINERIAPLSNVPILLISALEKTRIHKAMQTAVEVFQEIKKRIPTKNLNEKMLPLILSTPPPAHQSKLIRIKYVTQVEARYPTFVFFANHPKWIKESYRRFLENKIRENFGFNGCPVFIYFKEK